MTAGSPVVVEDGYRVGTRTGPVLGRPCPGTGQVSWKVLSNCESTVSCS